MARSIELGHSNIMQVGLIRFFGKFGILCFLVTPILRFAPFTLLPTNSGTKLKLYAML